MSLNAAFLTCDKCGHQWLFGQHGGHDCSVLLLKALRFEQQNLAHLSKINGELRQTIAAIHAAPVVAIIDQGDSGDRFLEWACDWPERPHAVTKLIVKPTRS